jgi:hypothetical protein
MGHITAWLDRPIFKPGLDNLGTQQPCIYIYTHLLPGITNATDRAVYFGFYPWFVRNFEARFPEASNAVFEDTLRKADCLLTLVAHRHAIVCDDQGVDDALHGASCPGKLKLLPAAREVSEGASIRISSYADRSEDNTLRYFKNPLGGLGQYYLGVLRDEYHLLAGERGSGIKYTKELGKPLADNFAEGLDADAFFAAIEADEVHAGTLDSLSIFCPCALHSEGRATAVRSLRSILLADEEPWDRSGKNRRLTLGLILDFLERSAGVSGAVKDPVSAFQVACYGKSLPDGNAWDLPEDMKGLRGVWALYLRNEMMSLAWEAIFKAALDTLEENVGAQGIRAAAEICADQELFIKALEIFGHNSFNAAVEHEQATLQPLDQTDDLSHETVLWRNLIQSSSADSVAHGLRMLVSLVARHGSTPNSYAPLNLPSGTLAIYPLTLDSLRRHSNSSWPGLNAREWLVSLLVTVLSTHQQVALRKYGQSGEDTLMFRHGDGGFEVERALPRIVATQPRLKQAFQILRDLELITPTEVGDLPVPTSAGLAALNSIRHV